MLLEQRGRLPLREFVKDVDLQVVLQRGLVVFLNEVRLGDHELRLRGRLGARAMRIVDDLLEHGASLVELAQLLVGSTEHLVRLVEKFVLRVPRAELRNRGDDVGVLFVLVENFGQQHEDAREPVFRVDLRIGFQRRQRLEQFQGGLVLLALQVRQRQVEHGVGLVSSLGKPRADRFRRLREFLPLLLFLGDAQQAEQRVLLHVGIRLRTLFELPERGFGLVQFSGDQIAFRQAVAGVVHEVALRRLGDQSSEDFVGAGEPFRLVIQQRPFVEELVEVLRLREFLQQLRIRRVRFVDLLQLSQHSRGLQPGQVGVAAGRELIECLAERLGRFRQLAVELQRLSQFEGRFAGQLVLRKLFEKPSESRRRQLVLLLLELAPRLPG